MSDGTSIFRRQHESLFGMGAEILMAMNKGVTPEVVRTVKHLVARFKGALLVHQRMENEALYPRLFAHSDPFVAESARALFEELGGIYDAFVEFEQDWGVGDAAERAPIDYFTSIRRVLKKLMLRVQREDTELYTLVQRADNGAPSYIPPALAGDDVPNDLSEERSRWAESLRALTQLTRAKAGNS